MKVERKGVKAETFSLRNRNEATKRNKENGKRKRERIIEKTEKEIKHRPPPKKKILKKKRYIPIPYPHTPFSSP